MLGILISNINDQKSKYKGRTKWAKEYSFSKIEIEGILWSENDQRKLKTPKISKFQRLLQSTQIRIRCIDDPI
jgi:hypothetical protein